jgi:hypothetical protein
MLTPQFSLRRLLLLVTACAVVSLILASGSRGYQWGLALSIAFGAAVALLLLYGLTYAMIQGLGLALARFQDRGKPDVTGR